MDQIVYAWHQQMNLDKYKYFYISATGTGVIHSVRKNLYTKIQNLLLYKNYKSNS